MSFRKIIFWTHLVIGLAAGLVIALMALTGASMAFEKQIIAFAERDLRHVIASTNNTKLSLQEILQALREAQPEARPQSITISSDPTAVIVISINRTNTLYINPYSGEIQPQGAQKLRAFFQFILRVHRWLGVSQPEQQPSSPASAVVTPVISTNQPPVAAESLREGPTGLRRATSTIVGVSVCIFLALCISGLVIWFPRQWNWRVLRPSVWFMRGQRGKARDWNWHNTIGFWSLPVLILITVTGIVMHFRSVGDWIYQRPEADGANASLKISTPEPGTRPLGPDALFAIAQNEIPDWETITLRLGARRARGPGQRPMGENRTTPATERPQAEGGERREGRAGEARAPQPVSISIIEKGWSPAPTQLQLDPYTGDVLRKEALSDFGFRRAFRTLNKSLHTGEWGGWFGQTLALFAALGTLVLVWTGFAMSWRRFFKRAG